VKYLLKSGASRDKLVLGVQFAGETFKLVDRNLHEIGSPSNGTGLQGPYTQYNGFHGYNEVCWVI
jgi:chitinase